MGGDVEMHDPPSIMGQNQKHIQDLEPDRGYGEEVDRNYRLDVIVEKSPPRLRWRLPASHYVLADAGLTDVKPEFKQFAMDAGRSPERIFAAHSTDQFSHIFGDCRSAGAAATNLPSPK